MKQRHLLIPSAQRLLEKQTPPEAMTASRRTSGLQSAAGEDKDGQGGQSLCPCSSPGLATTPGRRAPLGLWPASAAGGYQGQLMRLREGGGGFAEP